MIRLLLLLLATGAMAFDQTRSEVLWERSDRLSWFSTVVVRKEQFVFPNMERLAQRFLRRAGTSRRVVAVSVYPTRQIASLLSGMNCGSFRQWRAYYDGFPQDSLVAASVVAIGADAAVRLRSADGTIKRQVVRGRNPMEFSVGGETFEILAISDRTISRFEKCRGAGTQLPVVYVQTNAPLTLRLCEEATAVLSARLRTGNVSVNYRNDRWFVVGTSFPIMYPYAPPTQPPTEVEYNRGVQIGCMSAGCSRRSTCVQLSGPPLGAP